MRLNHQPSQRDRATAYLAAQGMSRLNELIAHGVTASTLSRLERDGTVTRLARGLYQLADASLDVNHTLAQASKLVPKGVIWLTSALAFHGLTDHIPPKVWIAIGPKEWRPSFTYPPARFARFSGSRLALGIGQHLMMAFPFLSLASPKPLQTCFATGEPLGSISRWRACVKHSGKTRQHPLILRSRQMMQKSGKSWSRT